MGRGVYRQNALTVCVLFACICVCAHANALARARPRTQTRQAGPLSCSLRSAARHLWEDALRRVGARKRARRRPTLKPILTRGDSQPLPSLDVSSRTMLFTRWYSRGYPNRLRFKSGKGRTWGEKQVWRLCAGAPKNQSTTHVSPPKSPCVRASAERVPNKNLQTIGGFEKARPKHAPGNHAHLVPISPSMLTRNVTSLDLRLALTAWDMGLSCGGGEGGTAFGGVRSLRLPARHPV